ncbi:hypothetical protein YB2330_001569 [Saitoella coloradoensis]
MLKWNHEAFTEESFLDPSDSSSDDSSDQSQEDFSSDDTDRLKQIERRQSSALTGETGKHGRLLLAALLDTYCELYETEPAQSKKLFYLICRQLKGMGILDEEYIEELSGVRETYKRAFKTLMGQAKELLEDDGDIPNPMVHPVDGGSRRAIGWDGDTTTDYSSSSDDSGDSEDRLGRSPFERPFSTRTTTTKSPGLTQLEQMTLSDWLLPDKGSRYCNEFNEAAMLGKGGFGSVWRAKNLLDGRDYAVKKIILAQNKVAYSKIFSEIKCLAKLDHPHVIRYYGSWLEHSEFAKKKKGQPRNKEKKRHSAALDEQLLFHMEEELSDDEREDNHHHEEEKEDTDGGVVFGDEEVHESPATDTPPSAQSSPWGASSIPRLSIPVPPSSSVPAHIHLSTSHRSNKSSLSSSVETIPRSPDFAASFSIGGPRPRAISTLAKTRARAASLIGSTTTCLTLFIQMHICTLTLADHLKERDYLSSGPLSTHVIQSTYLPLFRSVLEGVHYVHHDHGLVHRDIKPKNVFLDVIPRERSGAVELYVHKLQRKVWVLPKIGDFGLCVEDGQKMRSKRGEGTAAYAAPEQLNGKLAEGDAVASQKADVYSLGILLFELLHPFSTSMERANMLHNLRRGVLPEAFCAAHGREAALIMWMLSHQPSKRPTCQDLLEMDDAVMSASGTLLRSPAPKERDGSRENGEVDELRRRLEEMETENRRLRSLVGKLQQGDGRQR